MRSTLLILGAVLAVSAVAIPVTVDHEGDAGNPNAVLAAHAIGDTWQRANTLRGCLAMAGRAATARTIDDECLYSGLGPFIDALQLGMTGRLARGGLTGIDTGPPGTGLDRQFVVEPDLGDPWKWVKDSVLYTLPDTELLQRVLFTTPQPTRPDAHVHTRTRTRFDNSFGASPRSAGAVARADAAYSGPAAAWRSRVGNWAAPLPCPVAIATRP